MRTRIGADTTTEDTGLLQGFFTKKQAARKLGKSEHTLDRWYRMRQGPARIKIGRSVVYREEAIRTWLLSNSDAFPLTILATGENAFDWDTPYEGLGGHPRGAGSYALVLRLVREDDLMSLMTALGKMSYDVARFLEDSGVSLMAYKGRIQVGADADITIFDPETVTENSTMDEPGLPSTGIPYVLVNGTIVVKDSEVLEGVYPGQAVRMPVRN